MSKRGASWVIQAGIGLLMGPRSLGGPIAGWFRINPPAENDVTLKHRQVAFMLCPPINSGLWKMSDGVRWFSQLETFIGTMRGIFLGFPLYFFDDFPFFLGISQPCSWWGWSEASLQTHDQDFGSLQKQLENQQENEQRASLGMGLSIVMELSSELSMGASQSGWFVSWKIPI